jgi:hypothetical protein
MEDKGGKWQLSSLRPRDSLKQSAKISGTKSKRGKGIARIGARGAIPSSFKPYFANVDPLGHFKKVFFREGDRRGFFVIGCSTLLGLEKVFFVYFAFRPVMVSN